jgi:hypothetical protein
VEVVHEARTVLMGVHFVRKPRRAVMQRIPHQQEQNGTTSSSSSGAAATSQAIGTTAQAGDGLSPTEQAQANGPELQQEQTPFAPSVCVPSQS